MFANMLDFSVLSTNDVLFVSIPIRYYFAKYKHSLCSSSHQAEHHQQVKPGSVCEQVWSAGLVWDQWTGTNRRVSISYLHAKHRHFPYYLLTHVRDLCSFCFSRYIPAIVDHTGGLPCHGTYLLHQVTDCLLVYPLFKLTGVQTCIPHSHGCISFF